MKTLLLLFAILANTALPQQERAAAEQKSANLAAEQTAQKLKALRAASVDARKSYERARAGAEQRWNIATQIRECDGIIDPVRHGKSVPTSRSGNPDDAKSYLSAKEIYLKANLESAAKGDLASEALAKVLEQERRLHDEACAKVDQTYKAAAALRQTFEIIDADPESETIPTSASGNLNDLKNYVASKREYLKAKAELQKLEPFVCHITEEDLKVLRSRRKE